MVLAKAVMEMRWRIKTFYNYYSQRAAHQLSFKTIIKSYFKKIIKNIKKKKN